ncbi:MULTISPECIES: MotA/TolQ/ExbB proton channel family protein [Reinekea]|uniref:MotA/TolQ/ExbB proton channel family protein n=1 Tax=Reinekea forsetii TaxID=1336806 RepID=A0A2K8KRU7_9GAMM|nr:MULTISPECIES: MotA/TolQ/ExbB proton channel family protein [Reinekea]ATX76799.1 MotA/TolQ/ExbB proton channel family protein [Reinekea forsetii]
MFEIIKSGGWLMLPIVFSSVIALAITVERYWTLRVAKVRPKEQLPQVWLWIKNQELDANKIKELKQSSLFGFVLAAGLTTSRHGREAMKDAIQEAGDHVAHEMEKFLNTLGTIAAISPLLGLLGTVLGMVDVFSDIMLQGTGNTAVLAGGISKALITTAAGLSVAIPAVIFHRALARKIDELLVLMEQDSAKLVEAIYNDGSSNKK